MTTANAREKTALSRGYAKQWFEARETGAQIPVGTAIPPLRPARPDAPELLDPRDVPRRRPGTAAGRLAILHAVAHIELNAVDLHWDIIARFSHIPMPDGYFDDWVKAADEESKHFNLMADCLEAAGSYYGAMPAHAGMWRAAEDTVDDFMGRLAVVPMVLEARGLDVTPPMIEKLSSVGDADSVAILSVIYEEEVGHVAAGARWFDHVCRDETETPEHCFHRLVSTYFSGALKRPFNDDARAAAGLPGCFYEPLAEQLS